MKSITGVIESLVCYGVGIFAIKTAKGPKLPWTFNSFLLGKEAGSIGAKASTFVRLSLEERRKHLYVLGATGCGKTNLLLRLIDEEIKEKQNAIIIDLRGDLVDRIFNRLASTDESVKLCLIDLRDDEHIAAFNPLTSPGDPFTKALHLLEVLRSNAESWGVQLEETLRNCLIVLAQGQCSLLDIERLLEDESFRMVALRSCTDTHVLNFFERYEGFRQERKQSWSQPVLNKVTALLCVPHIRTMLSCSRGIDFGKLMDEPGQIVLIALAAHRFHGASHLLGGLMVSAIQSAAMARASTKEKSRNPVTLFVDEFETMASSSFASIIAEGRRFGLSLVLSHQNLSQLDPALRQVIRNNVAIQLFFQTGASDASELASDVTGLGSKEAVREMLLTQPVGHAILARKGQSSLQVITPESADPTGFASQASKLKAIALRAAMSTNSSNKIHRNTAPKGKEIRHEKLPRTNK